MKEKYSSGTDRQGSISSKKKPPVAYVGFFGSWDAPKHRFYLTFMRICMATIFLGLLYANVRMIQDSFLWKFILEDDITLIIMIAIEGMVLLTLALLASVSYKFYRNLKREEAEKEHASSMIQTNAHRLYVNLIGLKSELWSQFLNMEFLLVNGCSTHSARPYDPEPRLNFNEDQHRLWKQITRCNRIFGHYYDKEADPDLNAPSEAGVIPYKPLVERLESLDDGLREMFESGINIKNELSASDLITTRLTELEALQRRTIQILMSTDDTFRSLMPRLDQVADIGKYAPVIGTGVKAYLPVNCLSIDNYLVRQLNSADIYTIQDLKRHYMTDLRRLLGDENAELVRQSLRKFEPYFNIMDERPSSADMEPLVDPFDEIDVEQEANLEDY